MGLIRPLVGGNLRCKTWCDQFCIRFSRKYFHKQLHQPLTIIHKEQLCIHNLRLEYAGIEPYISINIRNFGKKWWSSCSEWSNLTLGFLNYHGTKFKLYGVQNRVSIIVNPPKPISKLKILIYPKSHPTSLFEMQPFNATMHAGQSLIHYHALPFETHLAFKLATHNNELN